MDENVLGGRVAALPVHEADEQVADERRVARVPGPIVDMADTKLDSAGHAWRHALVDPIDAIVESLKTRYS